MPDEQKQEDKKEVNFDELINGVQKKVDEKMGLIDHKLDKLLEKPAPKEEDEDDSFHSEDDDDDGYVTKKDLKSFAQHVVDTTLKAAKKTVETSIEEKTNQTKIDNETARRVPLIDRNSPEFDVEFVKEVDREMDARMKLGRKSSDPLLVRDATNEIYQRWVSTGRYVPKEAAKRVAQKLNVSEDSFSFSSSPKTSANKPNANQVALAASMGVNKDRLTQLMGTKGKN